MKQKDIYEKTLNITLTPINIDDSNICPIHAQQEIISRAKVVAPQTPRQMKYPHLAKLSTKPQCQ